MKVLLQASERRNPVTYGRIRRSRPPEVIFYVHPEAELDELLDELLDDWRGFDGAERRASITQATGRAAQ